LNSPHLIAPDLSLSISTQCNYLVLVEEFSTKRLGKITPYVTDNENLVGGTTSVNMALQFNELQFILHDRHDFDPLRTIFFAVVLVVEDTTMCLQLRAE
jgi:hypothetical protein